MEYQDVRKQPLGLSRPNAKALKRTSALLDTYRSFNSELFTNLTSLYCRSLDEGNPFELRKMIELSTKMTLVGHACADAAGVEFTFRRKLLSALYGGCCFLADSFIDDYGEEIALRYINRFEQLLTSGWFTVSNDREQLFWIIISRIFGLCDILDPMLRQAIFSLFLAQRRDIELRSNAITFQRLKRSKQLQLLKTCARDRSGHGIAVLAHCIAPSLPLQTHHFLFCAGSLIMYIDDHGDCWADKRNSRITYMNQVKQPENILTRLFTETISMFPAVASQNASFVLLTTFLYRYFTTRLEKHKTEQHRGGLSWAVYE